MLEEDIRAGESINLEFKRELPARDKKVIKTFVAFANGFGGKVIFGIDNSTKEVVGVPDEERARLQDAVTDMISDTCSPQILPYALEQLHSEPQASRNQKPRRMARRHKVATGGVSNANETRGKHKKTIGTPPDGGVAQSEATY